MTAVLRTTERRLTVEEEQIVYPLTELIADIGGLLGRKKQQDFFVYIVNLKIIFFNEISAESKIVNKIFPCQGFFSWMSSLFIIQYF